jgi:hypothetical protein
MMLEEDEVPESQGAVPRGDSKDERSGEHQHALADFEIAYLKMMPAAWAFDVSDMTNVADA